MSDAPELCEEDQLRAALYALIGHLFYAAPDAALLAQIASNAATATQDTPLDQAWCALGSACAAANMDALRDEHQTLFVGVGKSLVTPYTSAYVTHMAPDRYLLQLRQQLAGWGLARDEAAVDPEDHIAGLCDVMRHLITRGDSEWVQKELFNKNMYLCSKALCERVLSNSTAQFYAAVARFTVAFLEVEHEAFEMVEPEV